MYSSSRGNDYGSRGRGRDDQHRGGGENSSYGMRGSFYRGRGDSTEYRGGYSIRGRENDSIGYRGGEHSYGRGRGRGDFTEQPRNGYRSYASRDADREHDYAGYRGGEHSYERGRGRGDSNYQPRGGYSSYASRGMDRENDYEGYRGGEHSYGRDGNGRGRGTSTEYRGGYAMRGNGYNSEYVPRGRRGNGIHSSRTPNEHSHNQEYKCLASQFIINIGPKAFAFNYEVEIIHQFENEGGLDSRLLSKRYDREFCRHVVNKLFNFNDVEYVYDGQCLLWTNQLLEEPLEFTSVAADFDEFMVSKLRKTGSLLIRLKLVGQFNLSDFGQYLNGANSNGERRTQRNVCELILSQSSLNRGDYATGPGIGSLFSIVEQPFHGLVIREGNNKGVHVIDSNGAPQLIMSLEYSKKLFYPSGEFLLRLLNNLQSDGWKMADLEKLFCGLKLSLSYCNRVITFDKFTDEPVANLRVGDQSMKDFFKERWQLELRRLDVKGVIAKNDNNRFGNTEIYPLELLNIQSDQSVSNEKLPEALKIKVLEINRLKTADRYEKIMIQLGKLKLNDNDSIPAAFGLSVESKMIEGNFTRLKPLKCCVKNNQHLTCKDDGSFSFDKNQYLSPAKIHRLVVLSSQRNQSKTRDSMRYFLQEATRKGMIIAPPEYREFDTSSSNMKEWVKALRDLKDAFVICVDENQDSHSLLKIAGAINGVSTQHLQYETAKLMSGGGRGMTRENLVHSVNIKAGGLNHKVIFDDDIVNLNLDNENVFVIGLDVCHPTGSNFRGETAVPSTASVVGNYLNNPNAFGGTFFYQKPRQESVDSYLLQQSVEKMLQKNPRKAKINTVVILRDGVSEGQYSKVLDIEVSAVKKVLAKVYEHPNTRIVCIVVTKNGNARHFDITNKHPTSLPPRSVVTFGTRFNFKQFYLVPHKAFQGTAKAVMCTVLHDDVGCEMIEIQKFVLALTNLHQIVCAPVSLPEPVFLADSYALRGQEIFAALKQYSPTNIPRDSSGFIKFQELSTYLGFNFESIQ